MLFRRDKTKIDNCDKQYLIASSYHNIIQTAEHWIFSKVEPITQSEQIMLLDYLIDSLLEDICTAMTVTPLMERVKEILDEPFPDHYYDECGVKHSIETEKEVTVDLSASKIYVRPWNNERTASKLKLLANKDFVPDANHGTFFYSDINLCYGSQWQPFHQCGTVFSKRQGKF